MDLMSNKKVKVYIDTICSHVKFKEAHNEIRDEIFTHLIDAVEEHIKEGHSREDSIDMAIEQMGDPLDLGRKLNEVHKPKPEWSILVLTLVFSLIGVLFIYSISKNNISDKMFKKSIFMILSGLAIIFLLYFYDYRRLRPFSKYIYLVVTVFLVLNANIRIFPFTTDISYLAPIFYAIALAGMFSEGEWENRKNIINLGILLLPIVIFFARSSRVSIVSAAIYFVVALVICIMSGINIKHILGIIISIFLIALYSIISVPYRFSRVLAFLNPEKDAGGAGYINIQLRKVLTSSGLFGNGFDFNLNEMHIPELHTDFIFSYIVYTLGWIAGIVLISLIVIFFIRLIKTTKNIASSYGKLIVASFTAIFIVQFSYNILMVLGLAPIAGFSLPFISYGTLLNIANMVMIGIISSVYRRKNILEQ